jgi:hypothetical protein
MVSFSAHRRRRRSPLKLIHCLTGTQWLALACPPVHPADHLLDPVAHVTGEDRCVVKVLARSMRHPEEVTGRIAGLRAVTISVVCSSQLPGRAPALEATTPRA